MRYVNKQGQVVNSSAAMTNRPLDKLINREIEKDCSITQFLL